jgi:hypothetical protein
MPHAPRYLLNYRDYKHSLDGEAGVLDHILSKLPDKNDWLVEFGACDGYEFSNTVHLTETGNINAVLIEPQDAFFTQLVSNMQSFPKAHCLKRAVTLEPGHTLDDILSGTNIPVNFDLLVIDIDNNDYQIFESLQKYSPKVIMIEINNTFSKPNHEKVSTYNAPFVFGKHGSSLLSMTHLAESKGYKLICNISCNAIYVQQQYYPLFLDAVYPLEAFYTYEGVAASRLNELTFSAKIRKGREALRRDWVLSRRQGGIALGVLRVVKRVLRISRH